MFLEWKPTLEINVPVVDAEHRYLVHLVNSMHDKFTNNSLDKNLIHIFKHLANYTERHFANEESVMAKVNYPELENHKKQHQELLETARVLSEQYLDGSESITADTMDFLKSWVANHIVESDTKIGKFVERNPLPLDWKPGAAFSEGNKDVFKQCTFCGKKWHTFKEFSNEKNKEVIGCKMDKTNHMYNLIMVNCSCDTTLGLLLNDLVGVTEIPFILEEGNKLKATPSYCLRDGEASSCLSRCACKYTSEILKELNN